MLKDRFGLFSGSETSQPGWLKSCRAEQARCGAFGIHFATKLTADQGFNGEGKVMSLRALRSLMFAALLILTLQHHVVPSQLRSARLGQPAAEKTIQDFLRVMGALIGNPLLNGTASVWA